MKKIKSFFNHCETEYCWEWPIRTSYVYVKNFFSSVYTVGITVLICDAKIITFLRYTVDTTVIYKRLYT